jgi:hypothetical protein
MITCQSLIGGQKPTGFCHCLIEVILFIIIVYHNDSP